MFISGSPDGAMVCVNITIVDDGALEGNQTFMVTLRTLDPNDAVMVAMNTTTITIMDNDG